MNKHPCCTRFSLPVVLYFTRFIGQKYTRHPQITYYTYPCSRMQDAANSNGNTTSLHLQSYHWWELPQVSFLWRQKFCGDKHVFLTTKTCLSRQKTSFVTPKACLPREKFCRDKIMFVATKIILVATPANDTILAPCQTNPKQKGAAAITLSCVVFVHVKHHVYFNPLLSSSIIY